ncbi:MAG: GspE/PulE family protein [Nitrospinae bacterium]|nr:GspE/PulE family protein [Nitrospinota bacterium]
MNKTTSPKIVEFKSKVTNSQDVESDLTDLIQDLKEFFQAEALNLFSLDRPNRQLFSRNHISDDLPEIRVDVNKKSLVGYVASIGKGVNLKDANSFDDLHKLDPGMAGGSTLDNNLNFTTKSIMAIPLPHEKRLIGVAEIINKKGSAHFSADNFKFAKEISPTMGLILSKMGGSDGGDTGGEPQGKLLSIANEIHSAKNVDEILLELKLSIPEVFNADLVTIYAVDSIRNEIYSKMKTGDTINEIRVPLSPDSIAGFVATQQKMIIIKNVHDDQQLTSLHPDLKFDSSWDTKSGYKTKTMLVAPLMHRGNLMGVLQLINKNEKAGFNSADEKNAKLITDTLALAFFNQSKFVQPKPTKFSHLINNGLISDSEMTQAISKARRSQVDIETILINEIGIKREDLGKSLEIFYKIPYMGYSDNIMLPPQVMEGLNKSFMAKNNWVPVQRDEEKIVILTDNPLNQDRIHSIKQIFPKKKLEFRVGLKTDIKGFLNASVAEEEEEEDKTVSMVDNIFSELDDSKQDAIETVDDDEDMDAIDETDNITVRMVNKILIESYNKGVSDIHIEPGIGKDNMVIRFRKDGTCRVYQEIPYLYKQAMLSRIKIMSKLDIAEKRMPQDGKIKLKYGKKEIEYRVATCPTVGGNEDAVLRILAASKPIPLEKMNFSDRNLDLIKSMASKPYGLILCVGPTGSGKTTTLHSALGFINKPDIKIWTAEDPVEITQKGLRQVQMHDKIGLNFARAMRSFLRGDPDVIMVGEMRDGETASIGLEASLTGHLVFSTLHTNSAPETITRLLDMGMNPLNFADALLLILAQRLVRTLCKKCKTSYHPSKEEFDTLVHEYGEEKFANLDIEYDDDLMLKGPKGCLDCNDTGYAGRTGLHELLEGTDIIKRMIMKRTLIEDLRKQAIEDGMTTLKQDGIWKIFKGDCDLKQVLTVCIV